MTRRDKRWQTFQRELRRRRSAALVAVAAYPATVIVAAIGLAVAVLDGSVETGIAERVFSDLTAVFALGWIVYVLALPGRRRRYNRTRWYEIATNLADAFLRRDGSRGGEGTTGFDRTKTIVEALSLAGDTSSGTAVAEVIAEMNRGTPFARSLRNAGCPDEICAVVAAATSNRDLYDRLEEIITSYREERVSGIERWRRAFQPASVVAAGAIVLWIVVYIVIPVFTERLYRWSGAF